MNYLATRARKSYAIKRASEKGHLEMVKFLHASGADVQADDNAAIKLAAAKGHLDVVKYLHQNGADDRDAFGCAANSGRLAVVQYLHMNGADIQFDIYEALISAMVNANNLTHQKISCQNIHYTLSTLTR